MDTQLQESERKLEQAESEREASQAALQSARDLLASLQLEQEEGMLLRERAW